MGKASRSKWERRRSEGRVLIGEVIRMVNEAGEDPIVAGREFRWTLRDGRVALVTALANIEPGTEGVGRVLEIV